MATTLWDELYIPGEENDPFAPTAMQGGGWTEHSSPGYGEGPDGSSFGSNQDTPWGQFAPPGFVYDEEAGAFVPSGESLGYYSIDPSTGETGTGGDIGGCMDANACNYNPSATWNNGDCDYPTEGYDCDGNLLEDDSGADPSFDPEGEYSETGGCPPGWMPQWGGPNVGTECVPEGDPAENPYNPAYDPGPSYGAESEGAFHQTEWQHVAGISSSPSGQQQMANFLEEYFGEAMDEEDPFGTYEGGALEFATANWDELINYFSGIDVGSYEGSRKQLGYDVGDVYQGAYQDVGAERARYGQSEFAGAGSAVFAEQDVPGGLSTDIGGIRRGFRQETYQQEDDWLAGFYSWVEELI